MGDFIEEDPLDEAEAAAIAELEAKKATRRQHRGGFAGRAGGGVSKETWTEIQEIFGNGDDYLWALTLEDGDVVKPDQTLRDVRTSSQPVRTFT